MYVHLTDVKDVQVRLCRWRSVDRSEFWLHKDKGYGWARKPVSVASFCFIVVIYNLALKGSQLAHSREVTHQTIIHRLALYPCYSLGKSHTWTSRKQLNGSEAFMTASNLKKTVWTAIETSCQQFLANRCFSNCSCQLASIVADVGICFRVSVA